MKVLTVNCGSSTLKFELFEVVLGSFHQARQAAKGIIDRIGGPASVMFSAENGRRLEQKRPAADHAEASRLMLDWLKSLGLSDDIQAVGHRVIHGGYRFTRPTIINQDVISAVERLSELAPLHNLPSLEAITFLKRELGPEVAMIAVFDTAFHRDMPERARFYAIPRELAEKYRIERYGFHGLAHRYMAERCAEIAGQAPADIKLITLQLGNGCSAAAVMGGRSIDTSMGFTPLEGLVMGTRSGDIDPSLAGFIAAREKVDMATVDGWLNKQSGLLGISGRSSDMRELLEAGQAGDRLASLAIDIFCYRVRKYIGAYLVALGGADAVAFGGGIGENSPEIRARILEDLEWLGLHLDRRANSSAIGTETRITTKDSAIHAYVIPVQESMVIFKDTLQCLIEIKQREIR